MQKNKDFDYRYILICFLALLFIISMMKKGSYFGSSVDWYNQHIKFPEYFRTLFYSSGNFFPSFAFQLGGGQNIYNFSYYGLYSPLLIFSYLVPFVKMIDYMQVLNILIYMSIGVLSYHFFKGEVKKNTAFFGSLFLLLSTPILFHVHRHYMFINYLPFLFISLFCIRKYFKNQTISLFIIINTLLILTSYYYSIPAILVEVLYFTYYYLKNYSFKLGEYLKKGLPLALGAVLAIGISCILLLPTLKAIQTGRTTTTASIQLSEIILPNFSIKNILYDSYGLGLSIISIVSLIYFSFQKKKENSKRVLSIVLLITIFFPFIMYFLNGKLYIRSKILIPFIPLIILVLCFYLEAMKSEKRKPTKLLLILFSLFFLYNLFIKDNYAFIPFLIIDFMLTYFLLTKKQKKFYLNNLIVFLFLINIVTSYTETFVTYEYHEENNARKEIMNILKNDQDIYRMKEVNYSLRNANSIHSAKYYTTSLYSSLENKNYQNFLKQELKVALPNRNKLMLTSSNNIIYDTYFGIKYIIGQSNLLGYQKIKKNIYYNPNYRGIIYATNKIFNIKEYKKNTYPYNLEYLLQGVITEESSNTKIDSKIKKVDNYVKIENEAIKHENGQTIIKSNNDLHIKIAKSTNLKDKILFLQFKINNKSSCDQIDRFIKINGITNKLSCASKEYNYQNNNYTFHYVLADNSDYDIKIGQGNYQISDVELYSMDIKDFNNLNQNIDHFQFNYTKTKGDTIEGNIEVSNTGYLLTSIPYDEGFTIYIDGQKKKIEKVNTSFLGTKIKKGNHHVKLIYQAPLLKVGKIISFLSLILLSLIVIYEKFVRCKLLKK